MLAQRLHDGAFPGLQLDSRPASFFTLYPRSMVRYAVLMAWLMPARATMAPWAT